MNIKKKTLILVIILSMGIAVFSGCVDKTNSPTNSPGINDQQITKPASSNENPPNVPVNNPNNQNQIKNNQIKLELEDYNNGVISGKKPAGWSVFMTGQCGSLGVLVRDDGAPENQLFSFIDLHPFFLSQKGKQYWSNYIFPGGSQLPGVEMPVVSPFTPENFLLHFGQAAQTNYEKNYLSQMPVFEKVYIVSSQQPQNAQGFNAKTMRAVFAQNGKVTEGLFFVMLVPGMNELGDAYLFTGVTADKNNFKYMAKELLESVGSISINPQYVSSCQAQNEKISNDVSKTISATSDTIMKSYESKSQAEDISAENFGDYIQGVDRVYDPADTTKVYTVSSGWYEETYSSDPTKWNMNLQKVSPDSPLMLTDTLDGSQNIHYTN